MVTEARQSQAGLEIDRRLMRRIMRRVGNPRIAIRLWNGDEIQVMPERPIACMEIRKRRVVLDLLRSPSVGFGESYCKGLIEIHGDLLAFVNEITAAITRKRQDKYLAPKMRSLLSAIHANTRTRSRRNVHHHYDLGNEFYKLWLDERMVYTCAYYDSGITSLDDAQVAKLDHVCRKLDLRPGQKVIAYNNSREQLAFARQRVAEKGLDGRVTFKLDDYRNIHERCDAFVSIGMLEHVGLANFAGLGAVVKRCLKPEGIGLIHSIGRSHPQKADPWIVKYIFPGGHMPSLSEIMAVFEPHRFSIIDIENLRPHYARTCAAWLENFESVAQDVREMYSEEFVRMWRLYLAGSSAGFQSGTLQLFQILFVPYSNKNVPWTRSYQYSGVTRAD